MDSTRSPRPTPWAVNPAQQVNPGMITLAREARGLTQTELAKLASITQGALSKIENELSSPTAEMMSKIAVALGYPESFFYQTDAISGVGVSEWYYRRRQSVTNKSLDAVQARINLFRMHVSRLLKSVDIGEPQFPTLDPVDFNGGAAEVASLVRTHWMLPRGPIKDLTAVIEEAGGIVAPFDFGDAKIDGLSHWPRGLPPMFFINVRRPASRQRFTLAHELGHVIMHILHPNNDVEDQANEFAAELLMPAQDIKPYLTALTLGKLCALKEHWRVSIAALLYRAKELAMLGERQYRSFVIQMAPYKTNEPVEFPAEQAELWQDVVKAFRIDMGYSAADLARLLHLREEEVRSLYLHYEAPKLRVLRPSSS